MTFDDWFESDNNDQLAGMTYSEIREHLREAWMASQQNEIWRGNSKLDGWANWWTKYPFEVLITDNAIESATIASKNAWIAARAHNA